jgi:hypothetical protein
MRPVRYCSWDALSIQPVLNKYQIGFFIPLFFFRYAVLDVFPDNKIIRVVETPAEG